MPHDSDEPVGPGRPPAPCEPAGPGETSSERPLPGTCPDAAEPDAAEVARRYARRGPAERPTKLHPEEDPMTAMLVYMTAKDEAEARAVGEALVRQRLVACVNILPRMTSLFWWDGGVQDEQEVAFVAKTAADRVPEVVDAVRSLHSYDVPCVVAWPLADGHPDFLDWIREETRPR
jgi:periplasmic divalent cation tolerance protein